MKIITKLSKITIALLSPVLMVSSINAADVTVSGVSPWLNFDDTDTAGKEWLVRGYSDYYGLYDVQTSSHISNPAFQIVHSAHSLKSFVSNSSGDISLADGSVFIDRSGNRMGIGTATPGAPLHIKGGYLRWDWLNHASWHMTSFTDGGMGLYNRKFSTMGLKIYGDAPDQALEITSTGTKIKGTLRSNFVGNSPTNSDPILNGLQNLVNLSSNNTDATKTSDVGFSLRNAREGFTWNFRTLASGEGFAATKEGTGGAEFRITNPTASASGAQLFLGNGAKNTTGVWQNASSRALKENIKELSAEDAMSAFHQLKPMTYNYKTDKEESYVGFIAEDVPELVAINSRDSLSSMDMVAVLTKVVQEQDSNMKAMHSQMKAMHSQTKAMHSQMKVMQKKLVDLKAMKQKVAQLESLLTNLALQTTNSKKDKLSFNVK